MTRKRTYWDYFERFEIELPYIKSGWLDNRGCFQECGWGDHTSLSFDIINEKGWTKDFRNTRSSRLSENSRDYLIKEKKYILLDNPTRNNKTQVVVYNPFCTHTKSQIKALLKIFEYSEDMTMEILERFNDDE